MLAQPLVGVQRFFVTPDVVEESTGNVLRQGHIYILDTQNERVVEIDKGDGHVIQQMRMRDHGILNRLHDLQVDEVHNLIYLANGNQVVRAALPVPPPRTQPLPTHKRLPRLKQEPGLWFARPTPQSVEIPNALV